VRRAAPIACLLSFMTSACGYTFGSGMHEQGIRSLHIQAAGNDSWRQRLEAELSLAVSRELTSSDLLPAGRNTADAVLELRIVEEQERTLQTGDRQSPVREGAMFARVHMRLYRRSDGTVLIDRPVTDRAEFRSPIAEDLTSARQELVQDLARKIVLALETRI
jgi:outer membrane lipopolysaccharide assembly protein LptE/RlpB